MSTLDIVRLQYKEGRTPRTRLLFGVPEDKLTQLVLFGGDYFRYLRREGIVTVYQQEDVSCLDGYRSQP